MKKMMAIFSLVILFSFILTPAGMKLFSVEKASGLTANSAAQPDEVQFKNTEQVIPEQVISCANPIPGREAVCRAMEQKILDSTVRIYMYTTLIPVEGICCRVITANGYATVKDGRYLITHNHFNETLFPILQQGDPKGLVYINVINTAGEVLLTVPAQAVVLLVSDHQSLVLDFGLKDGRGVFESLGLSSASFKAPSFTDLQPGMEVAQIDWDGLSSHIQWTTIESVEIVNETPVVKLSSCIRSGASGGGLFRHGVHIGNNWSVSIKCGQELDSVNFSFAALNSAFVAPS